MKGDTTAGGTIRYHYWVDQKQRYNNSPITALPSVALRARAAGMFGAGLHRHSHEGADEGSGEKLADDGLSHRKRARKRKQRGNVATDGSQRSETEISKLRCKLIHVRRCINEMERAWDELLNELKGGSPCHANQKIGAYAALDTAPGNRAFAKHYEQHNADVEKQREGGKKAVSPMKKQSGMETRRT
jgi:hypothetical protein